MKKMICLLAILALVLSFFACGQASENPSTEATEPSVEDTTGTGGHGYNTAVTEATKPDCSDINEFEPNEEGVYQIHTAEGLLNMVNHPEGKFELLWHIDLGGAEWAPVGTKAKPFTGEIKGGYFTVSNFVIDTPNEDGDMGFFGTFAGEVKELNLADVTITTTADTRRAGLWCGHNDDGRFLRCGNATSTLTAAATADGAAIGALVGLNEGEFRNGTMGTAVNVSAAGKVDVGGIAGQAKGGKIQFIKNEGGITVTGSNKNAGLFAGSVANDAEFKGCVFLGDCNTRDGVIFIDYVGQGQSEKITDCLYRDNAKPEIPAHIQEKRDRAEQEMRAMGTVVWQVKKPLHYSCTCSLTSCAGIHEPGVEIHGIQYNHKGGSLSRMLYCLDEEGYLKEEFYMGDFDGFDNYIGSDCSTALIQAYWTISADINFSRTACQHPAYGYGCVAVGDWEWELDPMPTYYDGYIEATGEQRMYEAYACLRKADFIVNKVEAGGHTRMVAQDAVVVRNEAGEIDGMESYVITHEQGAPRTTEPYFSSWRVDYKYSFSSIYVDWYLPGTIEDFVTGEFEEPMAEMRDGAEGKLGLTTGTVYSNFFLDSVNLTIQDASGDKVFDQRMFTTVSKYYDTQHNDYVIRINNHEYDMAHFATPLREFMFEPGQSYTYTVTAHVGSGDDFVVAEGSFTNGSAQ